MSDADAIGRMREWATNGHPEMGQSRIAEFAADARALFTAYEELRQDHINVLKAALYQEPDGVALVNRLTTYALKERLAAETRK